MLQSKTMLSGGCLFCLPVEYHLLSPDNRYLNSYLCASFQGGVGASPQPPILELVFSQNKGRLDNVEGQNARLIIRSRLSGTEKAPKHTYTQPDGVKREGSGRC